ncbi:MAG: ATP-grasp domain-containing protein [Steroidobacteraceae bacterium]
MSDAAAKTRPIALVTARAARDLDKDLAPLAAALAEQGAVAEIVVWDDAGIDWSLFRLAVLRSTWDYSLRLSDFLAWLDGAARLTRVVNPPPVVRWNLDKHYLGELRRCGAAIVPTTFVEPGEDAATAIARALHAEAAADLVIKPAIGSGSRDAQRHPCADVAGMTAHVARLLAEQRSVLVQPYLDRVEDHGETALVYYNGEFSHAFRKGALLRPGSGASAALFAQEEITPRTPAADELELGARVLAVLPFGPLAYARIDLIRGRDGEPCVLELELAEPSMYFSCGDGSAARFARLLNRL